MSEDLISREKAYEVLTEYYHHKTEMQHKALREALDMVPSAEHSNTPNALNALDCVSRRAVLNYIDNMPSELTADGRRMIRRIRLTEYIQDSLPPVEPKRKTGKWTEKEVIHAEEAKEIITEWQSCKCSVCGRYDTSPYLYYFSEPRFCSWCGADMRGEDNE